MGGKIIFQSLQSRCLVVLPVLQLTLSFLLVCWISIIEFFPRMNEKREKNIIAPNTPLVVTSWAGCRAGPSRARSYMDGPPPHHHPPYPGPPSRRGPVVGGAAQTRRAPGGPWPISAGRRGWGGAWVGSTAPCTHPPGHSGEAAYFRTPGRARNVR